jgi:hypothetical protein
VTPKTDSCSKLFKQAGAAPDVISLNPSGQFVLKTGGTKTITVTGGKKPYDVRLLGDGQAKGITATTQYDESKATLTISADSSASAGTYAFLVSDETGIGRALTVEISKEPDKDADLPDCQPPATRKAHPRPTPTESTAPTRH